MRVEPHYLEIRRPDEVQIYESMMIDAQGAVTTGLLKGVRFVKDNRLLPRGFDKAAAPADIAVQYFLSALNLIGTWYHPGGRLRSEAVSDAYVELLFSGLKK